MNYSKLITDEKRGVRQVRVRNLPRRRTSSTRASPPIPRPTSKAPAKVRKSTQSAKYARWEKRWPPSLDTHSKRIPRSNIINRINVTPPLVYILERYLPHAPYDRML